MFESCAVKPERFFSGSVTTQAGLLLNRNSILSKTGDTCLYTREGLVNRKLLVCVGLRRSVVVMAAGGCAIMSRVSALLVGHPVGKADRE